MNPRTDNGYAHFDGDATTPREKLRMDREDKVMSQVTLEEDYFFRSSRMIFGTQTSSPVKELQMEPENEILTYQHHTSWTAT